MAVDPRIPPVETIREVTKEVLNRPEFAGPSAWDETVAAVLKAIGKWLHSVASWSAAHPTLGRIVAIALGLVLLACVAHLLYLALGDLLPFGRRREKVPSGGSRWDILEGAGKNWREALEAARKLLQQGDYRRAIWLAHRVLLGLLDEQGAIQFAGWKTNSYYLRECAAGHPWYAAFAELTEIYEQAIYGRRAAPPARAESAVLRVDQLYRESAG
ncbi:MAG TPA: DUF4129 domain-containing protein [Candidatus Binatia bacterium]|jgi:hypothetical protein